MQHWLFLAGAIALEVAGTTSMKLSAGFTKLVPSLLLFVFYAASFVALTFALKKIAAALAQRQSAMRRLSKLAGPTGGGRPRDQQPPRARRGA